MSRKLTFVALGLALALAVAVTPQPAAATDDAPTPGVERSWSFFGELEQVVDRLLARFVPSSWVEKSTGDSGTSVSGPVGSDDTVGLGPDFDPNGHD